MPAMARSPMTLRYQISVVLLLSALNGIVLLAAVIAFLTAPAAQPQDLYLESSLLLVWVLGVTGATLFAAYRVRSLLSQPLFELAGRAQDIANGDLTQPFPQARGGVELQALGEALESMRTHLVESLDKAEDQAQVVKTAPETGRPLVLVVDDAPEIRDLVALTLEDDCEILQAEDGQEALEQVQAHRPDLLVLDVMMPRKTGYEVCTALKADPETADIPVLMLSARGETRHVKQGLMAGADDYLPKPFDPEELLLRVQALLRRARR